MLDSNIYILGCSALFALPFFGVLASVQTLEHVRTFCACFRSGFVYYWNKCAQLRPDLTGHFVPFYSFQNRRF